MDHAERLTVPLRWWAQATVFVASIWLAVLAATADYEWVSWSVAGLGLAIMTAAFLTYGSARVEVRDGHLRAGRARVPLSYVGTVRELDAEGLRRQAGVDADARAHLLLRPYLTRGVRVDLTDPDDPTPYWLVACRRPHQLVAALESARAHRRAPSTDSPERRG